MQLLDVLFVFFSLICVVVVVVVFLHLLQNVLLFLESFNVLFWDRLKKARIYLYFPNALELTQHKVKNNSIHIYNSNERRSRKRGRDINMCELFVVCVFAVCTKHLI